MNVFGINERSWWKMKKDEKNVKELAKGILEEAAECGLDRDSSFITSYHLLEVQIEMLDALEKSFKEEGATITKEYVKGRENICIHPAVDKYTKTSDSAFNKILKLKEMLEKHSSSNLDDDFENDDL
jgi:hypothetical protein